jgi:ferric-dicitrate binding protein FerR (iron transport regulator)
MPKLRSPDSVVQRIEQLLNERQQHQDAITRIDQMLKRVGDALEAKRPGRPRSGNHSPGATTQRHRRGKFAVSAAESVLAFVRGRRNATTQEIRQHWTSEGRGGNADNIITLLVKGRKLKRTPLEGQRGSRYSLV